jgi:hypothetical protein
MSENSFINRLMVSAQENPLAAALIASGLVWMVAGNRIVGAVQAAGDAASPAKREASPSLNAEPLSNLNQATESPSSPETAPSAFLQNASRLKDAARESYSGVRDRVAGFPDPMQPITASYNEARTMLADVLERQPLVLGVMGLGIGAAIAGAFSATSAERELMGETSEAVRADLSERTAAIAGKLREGAQTLKAELNDTGAEALDRLQQAGKDAVGAAREKAGV